MVERSKIVVWREPTVGICWDLSERPKSGHVTIPGHKICSKFISGTINKLHTHLGGGSVQIQKIYSKGKFTVTMTL